MPIYKQKEESLEQELDFSMNHTKTASRSQTTDQMAD